MTKIYNLIILVSFALITIISCDNNPVNIPAEKIDIVKLAKTPGYTWYYDELDRYQPNQDTVNLIRQKFNPAFNKFCLFVKPSCSCPGTQKLFPAFMKILNSAGIPDSCYEIFSMSNTSNENPYKDVYKVNELPSFFLLKNNIPIYSVSDTLTKFTYNNETSTITLEELISASLSK